MKEIISALVLAVGLSAAGALGAQEAGTASPPAAAYPALEIQRPLEIAPRAFELRSSFSYLFTDRGFNNGGSSEKLPKDWNIFAADISLGYGVFRGIEVGASIPFLSGREVYATGQSVGDASLYGLFRLWQSRNQNDEIAFRMRITFPAGDPNRKMTIEDGQYVPDNIRTSDPVVDIFPALQARFTFPKFALRAGAEYGYRIGGNIQYGIDALDNTVRFDPGASFEANFDFLYQVNDRLVPGVSLVYFTQASNRQQHQSLDDANYLLSVNPMLEFQAAKDYDLFAAVGIPMAGKNSPNGITYILGLKARF